MFFFVYLLQIYVKYSIIISQVKEIKMLVNHNIIDNLCEDAGEQRKQKAQKYRDENRIYFKKVEYENPMNCALPPSGCCVTRLYGPVLRAWILSSTRWWSLRK